MEKYSCILAMDAASEALRKNIQAVLLQKDIAAQWYEKAAVNGYLKGRLCFR